ncbi:MAG TPA: hypothetical protein VGM32_17475, partial [Rhodopila sp.]
AIAARLGSAYRCRLCVPEGHFDRSHLSGCNLITRATGCGGWLPSGNGSGVGARLRVVGDAREQATQLNGGGQFALLLEDGADRGGNGLSNKEHGQKDWAAPPTGQANILLRHRVHWPPETDLHAEGRLPPNPT